MKDDILSTVIAAERDIRQRLDLERTRAREWLEKARADQERRLLEEETRIKAESGRSFGHAVRDAEARASAIQEKAAAEDAGLERLDDAALTLMIMKHIARILPGKVP